MILYRHESVLEWKVLYGSFSGAQIIVVNFKNEYKYDQRFKKKSITKGIYVTFSFDVSIRMKRFSLIPFKRFSFQV